MTHLDDYACPKCPKAYTALCLLLEHMRKDHGQNLTPLARNA